MRILQVVLTVAAVFIVAGNDSVVSASSPGRFEDFTLSLTTPKKSYVELEPIPIVVTLRNDTQESLLGHHVLDFGCGYVHISVTSNDGPREIQQLSLLLKLCGAAPRGFVPGEEVKRLERLNLKLNEIFPKPGKYKLTARLNSSDGKETVSSKPMEVEIAEPIGLDAQALQFIRTYDDPAFFLTGAR